MEKRGSLSTTKSHQQGGSANDIKSSSNFFRFLSQFSVSENKTDTKPTRIITSLRSLWKRPFTIIKPYRCDVRLTSYPKTHISQSVTTPRDFFTIVASHLLKLLLRQGCGAPRQQRPQLPYAASNHAQVRQQQRRIWTGPGSGRGRVVCLETVKQLITNQVHQPHTFWYPVIICTHYVIIPHGRIQFHSEYIQSF